LGSGDGLCRDIAEAALAHAVRDKIEAAYLRTYHLDARRPLMQAWADHCFGRAAPVIEGIKFTDGIEANLKQAAA